MDCKEAAHIIDKKDFKECSFRQRIGLKFHNFLCAKCRGYERETHLLRRLMTKLSSDKQCLSCEDKATMKENLEQITQYK